MDANAQIKKDHELHYLGGFIIGGSAYTYAYYKTGDKKLAFWSGLLLGLLFPWQQLILL